MRISGCGTVATIVVAIWGCASSTQRPSEPPASSTPVVADRLEATYDPASKRLTGRGTMRLRAPRRGVEIDPELAFPDIERGNNRWERQVRNED